MMEYLLNLPNYESLKLNLKRDLRAYRGEEAPPPQPASSAVLADGKVVSKTYTKDGQTITETFGDQEAKAREEANQKQLTLLFDKLGQRSQNQLQDADKYKQNFIDQNMTGFNDLFNPLLQQNKENAAQRFGSLDSSIYRKDNADIEKARSYGLSDITRNAELTKQDYLRGFDNDIYKQMAALQGDVGAYAGLSNQGFNQSTITNQNANNFAMQSYNALLKKYELAQAAKAAQMQMYSSMANEASSLAASDTKFKKNLNKLATVKGINIYSFEYDTDKYPQFAKGKQAGVMAQEIQNIIPDAVINKPDGLYVDYLKVREYLEAA